MGKVQCVSLKSKTEFFDIIEKSIKNIDTPLDKKIHDEYYKLKAELKSKNKNKKENENSQKQNFISIKKQMDRFIKWYYMSHPNQKKMKKIESNIEQKNNKLNFEDLRLKKFGSEYISPDKDNVPISTPNRFNAVSWNKEHDYGRNVIKKEKFDFEAGALDNQEHKDKVNKDHNYIDDDDNNNNNKNNNVYQNRKFNCDDNCFCDFKKDENGNINKMGKDSSKNLNYNKDHKNNNKNKSNKESNLSNSNLESNNKFINNNNNDAKNNKNLNVTGKINSIDNSALNSNNLDAGNSINNNGIRNNNNNNNNNKNYFNMNSRTKSNITSIHIPKPNKVQDPIKLIPNPNKNNSEVNEANKNPLNTCINSEKNQIQNNRFLISNSTSNPACRSPKNLNALKAEDCSPLRSPLRKQPAEALGSSPTHNLHAKTLSPKCKNQTSNLNSDRNNQSSIEYLNSNFNNTINNSEINFFLKPTTIELNLLKFHALQKQKFSLRVFKGPPASFRWPAWAVSAKLPLVRDADQYHFLAAQPLAKKTEIQIKKDLHRTLSDFSKFNFPSAQHCLFNVLKALSVNDPEVGYCQGMNFIAGFLLVMSDFNELEAFYLMLSLMSKTFAEHLGIRGFFSEGFPLLKLYLQSFHFLFKKKMPQLKKHFELLEIPDEVWISKWFQTLFTLSLPIEFCMRIWDCILSVGLEFLLTFALALMKALEADLLRLLDLFEVIEFFKKLTPFYLVENEGDFKAIEASLGLLRKLNVEEIIDCAKKISLPRNFMKMQMEVFEKSCEGSNFGGLNNFNFCNDDYNNKNEINKCNINNNDGNKSKNKDKFKFEDLNVKYDNFLNAYDFGGVAAVASSTRTLNCPFSPQLQGNRRIDKIGFDEGSDFINLNVNNDNKEENNNNNNNNNNNYCKNENEKENYNKNEYCRKDDNQNYNKEDVEEITKKDITENVLNNKNNNKNKNNNLFRIYNSNKKSISILNTASDNADLKTHNSTDPYNYVNSNKNNKKDLKEKSLIKIKFPTEISTTIIYHSESQISSSNNLNCENINSSSNNNTTNKHFKDSVISNKKSESKLKNKIFIYSPQEKSNSNNKDNFEINYNNNINTNKNYKKNEKIITSLTIENTPSFKLNKNSHNQSQIIPNFKLPEKEKINLSKDIKRLSNKSILSVLQNKNNNFIHNDNEKNNNDLKNQSKNNFIKIPNLKIHKNTDYYIDNKNNTKITKNPTNKRILDKFEKDSESKFAIANIPNDVNDWDTSGKFEDSLNDRIHSFEQENTSDPENNLNIWKKITTYTFNANTNRNLKSNFFLGGFDNK